MKITYQVLSADKGNATVVLDSNSYRRKVEVLLDPANYNIIDHTDSSEENKSTHLHSQRDQEMCNRGASGLPKTHRQVKDSTHFINQIITLSQL